MTTENTSFLLGNKIRAKRKSKIKSQHFLPEFISIEFLSFKLRLKQFVNVQEKGGGGRVRGD